MALAREWREDPEVDDLLMGLAQMYEYSTLRNLTLVYFAMRGRKDIEVFELFIERVHKDSSEDTRSVALGCCWRDGSEIRDWRVCSSNCRLIVTHL